MTEPGPSFERELGKGRTAHAYAVYGEPGLDGASAPLALARALLCGLGNGDASCDCPDCAALEAGNHPDLRLVRPEGARVRIDDVRAALAFLHRSPHQSRRRVVIVEAADTLTPEAANALLKMLEEPPAGSALILRAATPDSLLPTVRSRCRSIRLRPEAVERLAEILREEGFAHEEAVAAAALSSGNPGRGRERLGDPDFSRAAGTVREIVLAAGAGGPRAQDRQAQALADCAELGYPVLEWAMLALRDALAATGGGNPLWLSREEAERLAASLSRAGLLGAVRACEDARQALRSNVAARLTYAVLLSRWASLSRRARRPA